MSVWGSPASRVSMSIGGSSSRCGCAGGPDPAHRHSRSGNGRSSCSTKARHGESPDPRGHGFQLALEEGSVRWRRNPANGQGAGPGHFFAIHLDSTMAQGSRRLIHMFVGKPSTRLVENLQPSFHGRETQWSFFRQPLDSLGPQGAPGLIHMFLRNRSTPDVDNACASSHVMRMTRCAGALRCGSSSRTPSVRPGKA